MEIFEPQESETEDLMMITSASLPQCKVAFESYLLQKQNISSHPSLHIDLQISPFPSPPATETPPFSPGKSSR